MRTFSKSPRRRPPVADSSGIQEDLAFATRVVHGGRDNEGSAGALSVPISQSSLFVLPSAEEGRAIHEGEQPGFYYGRMGTPTQAALESTMAELEGGEAALATASGMAAIALALLTELEPGTHLVAARSLYTTSGAFLDDFLAVRGVAISRVDTTDLESVRQAICPETRAIYLETPSNPKLSLTDIRAVAGLARTVGATLFVDSTLASPYNQKPLDLGADVVLHSASKYLGGHGDVMAGVLVGKRTFVDRSRNQMLKLLGPTLSPFNAWLVLRGLKTLAVRMERHNQSALAIAHFLEEHPEVLAVHYPGLGSFPQSKLARDQMRGFGGVISFEVGTSDHARHVVDSVKVCQRAVSFGDVVSLIQHCSGLTQASLSPEDRRASGVTEGLLRLSVGLEEPRDLIHDLDKALSF